MTSDPALASPSGADGHAAQTGPQGGRCSGSPGWACWRAAGPGPGLGPRPCWVAVPAAGPGLPHPSSRRRAAERGCLGRGLHAVAEEPPIPRGASEAGGCPPGNTAATSHTRNRASWPLAVGPGSLPRCTGRGGSAGSGCPAGAPSGPQRGRPSPGRPGALLPPGGPNLQLHARWPAALDRTPGCLSRVLGWGVTTGLSGGPSGGHETAEHMLGWLCPVRAGCRRGPSSQKGCVSGTAL